MACQGNTSGHVCNCTNKIVVFVVTGPTLDLVSLKLVKDSVPKYQMFVNISQREYGIFVVAMSGWGEFS